MKCVTDVAEAIVFCGTVAAKLATDLARVHSQILQMNRICFVEVEVDAADAVSWWRILLGYGYQEHTVRLQVDLW